MIWRYRVPFPTYNSLSTSRGVSDAWIHFRALRAYAIPGRVTDRDDATRVALPAMYSASHQEWEEQESCRRVTSRRIFAQIALFQNMTNLRPRRSEYNRAGRRGRRVFRSSSIIVDQHALSLSTPCYSEIVVVPEVFCSDNGQHEWRGFKTKTPSSSTLVRL